VKYLFRRILVGALLATLGTVGAGTAEATADGSGADVAVGLHAAPRLLIPGAQYTVSVTNNGPEPLVNAIVVVQLDPRVAGTPTSTSCSYDATDTTLTCPLGALAVGATTTASGIAYFTIAVPPHHGTEVDATATLLVSTPDDPDATNNSARVDCWATNDRPYPPSLWPPPMFCATPPAFFLTR